MPKPTGPVLIFLGFFGSALFCQARGVERIARSRPWA
jgi:hypothetical protein